jgi:hypothetical protein
MFCILLEKLDVAMTIELFCNRIVTIVKIRYSFAGSSPFPVGFTPLVAAFGFPRMKRGVENADYLSYDPRHIQSGRPEPA